MFNPNFYIYFRFTNQNLFTAKATPVKSNDMNELPPSYYKKGLYMEKWLIISNIGELATNGFECVREDKHLVNFAINVLQHVIYNNTYTHATIIDKK